MQKFFLGALVLALAIGNAMADDTIKGLQNKTEFLAMKAQVTQDLGDHQKYKEITPADQKTLVDTLSRMDERWQKADAPDGQLSPNDQTAMANDQEVVTGILTHSAAGSRMVCERVAEIGSNLPKRVCKSVAQREREMKASQDAARNINTQGSK